MTRLFGASKKQKRGLSAAEADRELRLRAKASEALVKAFRRKRGMAPAIIVASEQARADALGAKFLEPVKRRKPKGPVMKDGRRRSISPTNVLFHLMTPGECWTVQQLVDVLSRQGWRKPVYAMVYFELTKWKTLGMARFHYRQTMQGLYNEPVELTDAAWPLVRMVRANPCYRFPQARVAVNYSKEGGRAWGLWRICRMASAKPFDPFGRGVTGWRMSGAYKALLGGPLAGGRYDVAAPAFRWGCDGSAGVDGSSGDGDGLGAGCLAGDLGAGVEGVEGGIGRVEPMKEPGRHVGDQVRQGYSPLDRPAARPGIAMRAR